MKGERHDGGRCPLKSSRVLLKLLACGVAVRINRRKGKAPQLAGRSWLVVVTALRQRGLLLRPDRQKLRALRRDLS